MPTPKGKLVTPVGFDASGDLQAILLDTSGRVIPASGLPDTSGTQVLTDASATNTETTVYSVPSGNTLYIDFMNLYVNNTVAAIEYVTARFYDGTPTLLATIYLAVLASQAISAPYPLARPIAIPSGGKVTVFSPAAGVTGRLFLHGYIY